jgi:hypothetical protein
MISSQSLYETSINAMIERKRMSIENIFARRVPFWASNRGKAKISGRDWGLFATGEGRKLRGGRKRNKSQRGQEVISWTC